MRFNSITHRRLSLAIVLFSWGSVAVALFTQHVLDMQPCPWCIAQRVLYLLAGALALLGCIPSGQRGGGRAAALLVNQLVGLTVASAFCVALYQNFVAAADGACMVTAADKFLMASGLSDWLPEVFEPRANCAEANVGMLGVPYSLWSAALAMLLMAINGLDFVKLLRGSTTRSAQQHG